MRYKYAKMTFMKKVLITGNVGFIGSHLSKTLKANGVEIIEFSLEKGQQITDSEDFLNLPKVDTVFHLAAVSGYKDSKSNPKQAYEVNVAGTVNVLEYCRKVKAKMIFPSTYVYDKPYEEYKKETDLTGPTTHYSHTKFLGEGLCKFYSRVYKTDTLIMRTSNVYGIGQDKKYIVPMIVNHIIKEQSLQLTKPNVERSYIYIDDIVKAFMGLAKAKTKPGEVFNAASLKPTSLQKLVSLVEEITGKKAKVNYSGESRPHEVPLNRYDTTKIKKEIGWEAKVSLKEGLKQYLATIKS